MPKSSPAQLKKENSRRATVLKHRKTKKYQISQKKAQEKYRLKYITDKSFREEVLLKKRLYLEKNPEKKLKYRERDNAKKREKYAKDKEFRNRMRERTKKYHAANPEINKKSYKRRMKENPEKIKATRKKWIKKNIKKIKANRREYEKKNREKINLTVKKWRHKNREKVNERARQWSKDPKNRAKINTRYNKRVKSDVIFRIRRNLKVRIYEFIKLKKGRKYGTMKQLLGCDWQFFKSYIENKFQPGMTWDNYGKWHIDHIKPISKFDLSLKSEQYKSCHHTNLQPLWALDNIRKQDN